METIEVSKYDGQGGMINRKDHLLVPLGEQLYFYNMGDGIAYRFIEGDIRTGIATATPIRDQDILKSLDMHFIRDGEKTLEETN